MWSVPCPAQTRPLTPCTRSFNDSPDSPPASPTGSSRYGAPSCSQHWTAYDLGKVVHYLQREIKASRRNPGALKLRNLLQPDRFEEDLALAVAVSAPTKSSKNPLLEVKPMSPEEQEKAKSVALAELKKVRDILR